MHNFPLEESISSGVSPLARVRAQPTKAVRICLSTADPIPSKITSLFHPSSNHVHISDLA